MLIPGELEAKMRAERTKNGVPLPDDTLAAIVNAAREVGVSEVGILRATADFWRPSLQAAEQSRAAKILDCFVAALLAMTAVPNREGTKSG